MKRSNIIITSFAILFLSWLMLSGWLYANAYDVISHGKTCSYAKDLSRDNIMLLPLFKNIKVEVEQYWVPQLTIRYGKKTELSCSNNLKKNISYSLTADTLYLRVKTKIYNYDDYINISVPFLNSVNLKSGPSDSTLNFHSRNNDKTTISGFNANTLFIENNCRYSLLLDNNKLNKLELRGDFKNNGKIEIRDYPDYDSLNVNYEGKNGTLIFRNPVNKVNPKQRISIKVPGIFRIESDAIVANKVIIKK